MSISSSFSCEKTTQFSGLVGRLRQIRRNMNNLFGLVRHMIDKILGNFISNWRWVIIIIIKDGTKRDMRMRRIIFFRFFIFKNFLYIIFVFWKLIKCPVPFIILVLKSGLIKEEGEDFRHCKLSATKKKHKWNKQIVFIYLFFWAFHHHLLPPQHL